MENKTPTVEELQAQINQLKRFQAEDQAEIDNLRQSRINGKNWQLAFGFLLVIAGVVFQLNGSVHGETGITIGLTLILANLYHLFP